MVAPVGAGPQAAYPGLPLLQTAAARRARTSRPPDGHSSTMFAVRATVPQRSISLRM